MNRLTLQQEVTLLRSAVIGLVGKDKEGTYRSAFVKSTLATLRNKPTNRFASKTQFLADIFNA